MGYRRVGGVLAALCVAAAASGVLAIAMLAPSSDRASLSGSPVRSGWPIAGAFSSPASVSRLADDPDASARTGTGRRSAASARVAAPAPAPAPAAPAVTATPPAPTPAADAPAPAVVARTAGLPVAGEATGYGCAAALAYLSAYAAPGFWLVCPGYARGHQAMTACQSGTSPCSLLRIIVIADPCPNAYMNEASNSWAFMGASDAPFDPYGACN